MKIEYSRGCLYMTRSEVNRILNDLNKGKWEDFTSLRVEDGAMYRDDMKVVLTEED